MENWRSIVLILVLFVLVCDGKHQRNSRNRAQSWLDIPVQSRSDEIATTKVNNTGFFTATTTRKVGSSTPSSRKSLGTDNATTHLVPVTITVASVNNKTGTVRKDEAEHSSTSSSIDSSTVTTSFIDNVTASFNDSDFDYDDETENVTIHGTFWEDWKSVFTKKYWEKRLCDRSYLMGLVVPIAAGIAFGCILTCSVCICRRLCKKRRYVRHRPDKKYDCKGRDDRWMLLDRYESSDDETV